MTATDGPPLVEREKSGASDGGKGEGSVAGSVKGSVQSSRKSPPGSKGASIPTPNLADADNPAADLRNMRRIIAEDPDWSLATVPMLVELVISHVVDNFESKLKIYHWLFTIYMYLNF